MRDVGDGLAAELAEVTAERDRLRSWLHERFMHPGYEYETTTGPRKMWDYASVPPEGEGWERNLDAGRPGEGWDRFDYHEESYWRRRRPDALDVDEEEATDA